MPSGRPTLSLCLYTNGPADRVRALLELCRPLVDEIVVAVDGRRDPRTLDACAGLADRAMRAESRWTEAVIGWLMRACRGDWILRLDSDEVPGAALLERIPRLVQDRFPLAIHVTRRWLWPDKEHYIATPPWLPDYQVRLVRNLPGAWSISGTRHSAIEVEGGDQKLLDLPIYHADLIVSGHEVREAKASRYELDRPGHHANGFPVNDMYLPERHEPAVETVPERDSPLIERLLAGSRVASSPGWQGMPRLVPEAEIMAAVESRVVFPTGLGAEIRWGRLPDALSPGSNTRHELIVENRGSEWWPRGTRPPHIRIGYRWFDPHATQTFGEGRAYFTEAVAPGATTRLMVDLDAPEEPGVYLLEVDLVLEHVRWCGHGRQHLVSVGDPAYPPGPHATSGDEARGTADRGADGPRRRAWLLRRDL